MSRIQSFKKRGPLKSLVAVCALGTLTLGQQAIAEEAPAADATPEAAPMAKAGYNTILPKGKTLPEGVTRLWIPYNMTSGNEEYDADGNKGKVGADIKVNASALVFEYGISKGMSFQLVMPYYLSQSAEANFADAAEKALTTDRTATLASITTPFATAFGCASAAECPINATVKGALAAQGLDISASADGTSLADAVNALSDTVLTEVIRSTVQAGVDAANVDKDGATGLGDIQIGVLKELYSDDKFMFSVGAGLRIATGKFKDEAIPTGRGTTDIGLRLNFDYLPMTNMIVSWEHYSEQMIQSGKTGGGTYKRVGPKNYGDLTVAYNLGGLHDSMKALGLTAGYSYDYDGEGRVDGVAVGSSSEAAYSQVVLTASGLEYGVPGSIEIEQNTPMSGKNSKVLASTVVTLKLYLKF